MRNNSVVLAREVPVGLFFRSASGWGCLLDICYFPGECPDPSPPYFVYAAHQCSQDKEVAVVVSFLEIYCDRVRDLGEAFMSHGDAHGLRTTSDVHQKMKSVRIAVSPFAEKCSPR